MFTFNHPDNSPGNEWTVQPEDANRGLWVLCEVSCVPSVGQGVTAVDKMDLWVSGSEVALKLLIVLCPGVKWCSDVKLSHCSKNSKIFLGKNPISCVGKQNWDKSLGFSFSTSKVEITNVDVAMLCTKLSYSRICCFKKAILLWKCCTFVENLYY